MNYILAIDQGTSSTRAMLYSSDGVLVTSSQYQISQYYPQPGWVEQDPEEIWQKTLRAMRDVVSEVNSNSIIACGITNQRETTVVWDKGTGRCLAPAIVWQDRRTAEYCHSLVSKTKLIQEKTGLILDSYFSASKLNWLLTNNTEVTQCASQGNLAFGTMDSFLIWRLTKGLSHVTDSTNASRTMIYNIHSEEWDNELLTLFEIPKSVLPRVIASDSHFGMIDNEWLGFELPITGVAGDQQAALIGQGCFTHGMVKATFGTGGFLLLNTGDKAVFSANKLLTTIAYKIQGKTTYGLEGSIYHAGTTVKWLRDELKIISSASETEALAESLTSNEGVYLISSFTGLGAPHWSSVAGASMFGISRSTNKAHFARAALEGVCYQTRDALKCMRDDSQLDVDLLRVDGGMAANIWFLQFLSDQCQLKVEKPKDIETTARGAAILAGIGCGLYQSTDDLKHIELDTTFNPQRETTNVEHDYQGWLHALKKGTLV